MAEMPKKRELLLKHYNNYCALCQTSKYNRVNMYLEKMYEVENCLIIRAGYIDNYFVAHHSCLFRIASDGMLNSQFASKNIPNFILKSAESFPLRKPEFYVEEPLTSPYLAFKIYIQHAISTFIYQPMLNFAPRLLMAANVYFIIYIYIYNYVYRTDTYSIIWRSVLTN